MKFWAIYRPTYNFILTFPKLTQVLRSLSLSYKLLDHKIIYTAEYIALLEEVHVAVELHDPNINILFRFTQRS